jgi:hypothetical protein
MAQCRPEPELLVGIRPRAPIITSRTPCAAWSVIYKVRRPNQLTRNQELTVLIAPNATAPWTWRRRCSRPTLLVEVCRVSHKGASVQGLDSPNHTDDFGATEIHPLEAVCVGSALPKDPRIWWLDFMFSIPSRPDIGPMELSLPSPIDKAPKTTIFGDCRV